MKFLEFTEMLTMSIDCRINSNKDRIVILLQDKQD